MRLTVVGGGSTYTPELIDGVAGRRSTLDVDEIVLVDPDEYRLKIVGEFSQRLLDHAGLSRRRVTSGRCRPHETGHIACEKAGFGGARQGLPV